MTQPNLLGSAAVRAAVLSAAQAQGAQGAQPAQPAPAAPPATHSISLGAHSSGANAVDLLTVKLNYALAHPDNPMISTPPPTPAAAAAYIADLRNRIAAATAAGTKPAAAYGRTATNALPATLEAQLAKIASGALSPAASALPADILAAVGQAAAAAQAAPAGSIPLTTNGLPQTVLNAAMGTMMTAPPTPPVTSPAITAAVVGPVPDVMVAHALASAPAATSSLKTLVPFGAAAALGVGGFMLLGPVGLGLVGAAAGAATGFLGGKLLTANMP
jgi:hypothetical protein